MMHGIERGQVFYIERFHTEGSEQQPGRPAIVVSNDTNNHFSDVVTVVYITSRPKTNLPTHVSITSTPKYSTALCEQPTSVSKNRAGDWCATLSNSEMAEIDNALMIALGIERKPSCAGCSCGTRDEPPDISPHTLSDEYIILKAERDLYEKLYRELINTTTK
jgi:mRNA interferase MazF